MRNAATGDGDTILALATDFATSFAVEAEAFHVAFASLVAADDACLAVAEAAGEVIGYVLGFDHFTFYANGRVARVEEIAVRVDWRRQGVGNLLMQHIEEWATNRGCKLVALATRRAAAFYEAIGYEASATYYRKLL